MKVHCLTDAPPLELAQSLARFEEQFLYPLGPGRSFRISHGNDYSRFFRAIGAAACFVAERDGEVLGVLGLAMTSTSGGQPVVYLGDLKVAPKARGGRVLTRLAEAAGGWCSGRAERGFGVVMDGTPTTPDRYTGRLGIPPFKAVAQIAVLRLPVLPGLDSWLSWEADAIAGERCFARLTTDRFATHGGNPAERSESPRLWLVSPDRTACGRLEDTRRAKQLIADDGSEMVSAHLSCIAYRDPGALAELLRVACGAAAGRGFPALFAAVPVDEAPAVLAALASPAVVVAPATVYAVGPGLEPGSQWTIHTAEI